MTELAVISAVISALLFALSVSRCDRWRCEEDRRTALVLAWGALLFAMLGLLLALNT